ncbi:uncharacterized protein EV420DRAFT_1764326 [Desarmillaria tabescens]|uniref:DUF6534 domain-containing protein n=1 Tax=Armillaria tabescens TaxID=1929756 RepID=A0AA39KG54_ARMTA|nr:uncharacterized protein EV420DRAFT_1764326 [Desarmillaria tabescens]KAK0458173.1 hypothetical protein EV420DRAFT_1764326 [Desarmillaria tabescens]
MEDTPYKQMSLLAPNMEFVAQRTKLPSLPFDPICLFVSPIIPNSPSLHHNLYISCIHAGGPDDDCEDAGDNSTFGAYLIGVIASACLFGVTCTQTWYYFTRYSDVTTLKVWVGAIWILEVLHVAFPGHAIYYYVILHYGDPAALTQATWTASLNLTVTGLTGVLVYLFYARRIYYLSNHNVPLVAAIIVLSVCRLGTSVGITAYSIHLKDFVRFEAHSMTSLVRASLAIHVVTDILVAGSLCYYLHTSRTGIKRTDTMINRLMVYAVHNGLITAVADILVIAFNTAYPGNLIYLAVYQVVANLYSNSLLATLNARRPSKQVYDHFTTEADMLSLSILTTNPNKRHVDINITSTTEFADDTDRNSATNPSSKVGSF